MASISPHDRDQRPSLRLYDASDLPPDSPDDIATGGLSPQMTLSEFFQTWFLPIVLASEGRDAATITSYRESIGWWHKLTSDPPLEQIDEYTVAAFKRGLREATYRRGKCGKLRQLGAFTISKHLRQVRTVLKRIGPTINPERPGKSLVAEVPHLRVEKPRKGAPKRPFTIGEAKRIIAATPLLPTPRYPHGREIMPSRWWRAFCLVLFYTGLRVGTVLKLKRSMIEVGEDGKAWLQIPGSITKTGKPVRKFLHPVAAKVIHSLGHGEQIFPWKYWRRHLANRHKRLQQLAGFPRERMLSPHAWRRTHATEMAKLGAMYGRKIAQHTLDHEDEETTSTFYVDIEAELIAQLPDIDCSGEDPRQLGLF